MDNKIEKSEALATDTTTKSREFSSPLLASLSKGDSEIRNSRATRTVGVIQGHLSTKWNQILNEFRQLELRYETALDLSPRTTVELGIEVGDVNKLVSELSTVVEAKYNMYNFRIVPLHDLMKQCFTIQEMETLYKLPTL
jgi:hypothetical protein